ncbi:MAG: DUF5677 domain-containing protein, partial [bacterium]|nr:DUF5677 domain-containing protein [bacterium]
MAITTEELRKLTKELLENTDELVISYPKNPDDFLQILVGICRKNKFTLEAIDYLSNDILYGNNALAIMRSMLEDVIMVEYMIVKGKTQMALKFKEHLDKQIKIIKEFEEELLKDSDEVDLKKLEADFQEVEEEVSNEVKKKNRRHSWIGKSVEEVIDELHELGVLKDFDFRRITMFYTLGSWKNHLNPYDVVTTYLDSERQTTNSEHSLKQALMFGIIS